MPLYYILITNLKLKNSLHMSSHGLLHIVLQWSLIFVSDWCLCIMPIPIFLFSFLSFIHSRLSTFLSPNSEMSRPRCVYINNRCRYQSVTQQFLKRCLIKDDSNYMFRPIVAIIRFSSKSMVVVLYMIGMVMSRWWDLIICDVCYILLLRGTGVGFCDVHYAGMYSSSMSARCCPMWVFSLCLSIPM